MNEFSITNKITFKDYLKLTYSMLYKGLYNKAIILLAILYLCFLAISFLFFPKMAYNYNLDMFGELVCVVAVATPLLMLFVTYRGYKTNSTLHQQITTTFNDSNITQASESFSSTFKWNTIYKIIILNNWVLIYKSKMLANFTRFQPEDQLNIDALKTFVENSNPKIKYKW